MTISKNHSAMRSGDSYSRHLRSPLKTTPTKRSSESDGRKSSKHQVLRCFVSKPAASLVQPPLLPRAYEYTDLVKNVIEVPHPSSHKRPLQTGVHFASTVTVFEVPSRRHYSPRAHKRMWNSHRIMRKNAKRNVKEYWHDTLGINERWRECKEEPEMISLPGMEQLYHPKTYKRMTGMELFTNIILLGLPILFDIWYGVDKYEEKMRAIDYGDRRPQPSKGVELGTAFCSVERLTIV